MTREFCCLRHFFHTLATPSPSAWHYTAAWVRKRGREGPMVEAARRRGRRGSRHGRTSAWRGCTKTAATVSHRRSSGSTWLHRVWRQLWRTIMATASCLLGEVEERSTPSSGGFGAQAGGLAGLRQLAGVGCSSGWERWARHLHPSNKYFLISIIFIDLYTCRTTHQ
jgi:hypothetical protein